MVLSHNEFIKLRLVDREPQESDPEALERGIHLEPRAHAQFVERAGAGPGGPGILGFRQFSHIVQR